MIAEIIATYHGTQDIVQVAALIKEDDGTSLHQHIQTAHVALMHNRTPMLIKVLTAEDYNEEEQQFMLFFINPPIQRDVYVELAVTLIDGRTAQRSTQVSAREILPYQGIASNPVLAGIPVKDHTNTWDAQGRERKPD